MIQFYKQYKKHHHDMRCEVLYDFNNGILHILDTNEPNTYTVTNGIDLFIDKILADLDIPSFEKLEHVICYCTDGVPFKYMCPGYKAAPEELLYPPFQQRSLNYTAS